MTQQAYLWGLKAAREGIPYAHNPYKALTLREAWSKGHKEESAALVQIESPRNAVG